MARPLRSSRSWFQLGPLGPFVAVPQTWEGWAAMAGLIAPAIVFARLCGDTGQLLAIGLCAFLFGLAYAMAEENRLVPYAPPRRREPPPVANEALSL